jgi:hypothetical protein
VAEVAFFGEQLKLVDTPPKYALMVYADRVSGADLDNADGETEARAQAAILRLARACVASADRAKFERLAEKNDAGLDDMNTIIMAMMEAVADATERPTEQPSVSSDGPADTEPKSATSADDKLLAKFDGRPDKQAVILDLKEFLESQAS